MLHDIVSHVQLDLKKGGYTRKVILEKIFKLWVAIFGSPKKLLVDNGGE